MAERSLKVVLLGDQGVGKTSIRAQFVQRYFASSYRATIGANFLSHAVKTRAGDQLQLQIWDTAGQERFNAMTRAFYRGAEIAILVYDVTNAQSFYSLRRWLDKILEHCNNPRLRILIVGNKTDQHALQQISRRQAVEFAQSLPAGLIGDVKTDVLETSARRYQDVERVFQQCAEIGHEILLHFEPIDFAFDQIDLALPRKKYSCC
ncbi:hypothetical protein KL918_005100 [Ogataea parapolymorpha]|uniref:GTPase n=2 Tax=Saccharomycotina TaxID=147537 RepID=W1QJK2_OGAPD|nr:GTPase [Ogataea parapolymorpha DL-1]KAG7864974.1 hypothetical protein KL918_005100 [Ogataea parapolymorpha]CAM90412.2 putative GTPase [Saccharomyces cerevisiae]ESX02053.1 GTPase [Ogataea parapolymorpha DL-1]KAG7871523.1 hypothetical protein KL916_003874 [Ogataea parapolymorpha]KAG7884684.1 hypothetical protein KL938_001811 [Ogataea parapolymorpha]